MSQRCTIKQLVFISCLLAAGLGTAAQAAPADHPPVDAIWRVQQIELSVRSGKIYYSCDGLRSKIGAILKEVGARDGTEVEIPCHGSALTNNTIALITVSSPIEATPENVREAATYSPEEQLAARLNKLQLPSANDLERFSAQRRTIALTKKRHLGLDAGDCPLLRALTAQVFPQLDVELEHYFSCPDTNVGRIRPKLHVTALVPTAEPVILTADRK